VAQLFSGGDDERLEVVDRLRAGADRAASRDQQHADGFAVAAGRGLCEVFALERFAGGTDRVERVGLGAVAPGGALGAVDLDDPFALREQEHGQPGAEAAGRLDRPDSAAARVPACVAQQALVAEGVGRDRRLRGDHSRARRDRGGRVRVAVRVDADHVVRVLCEHAHRRPPARG
jgi:hypothetical protein